MEFWHSGAPFESYLQFEVVERATPAVVLVGLLLSLWIEFRDVPSHGISPCVYVHACIPYLLPIIHFAVVHSSSLLWCTCEPSSDLRQVQGSDSGVRASEFVGLFGLRFRACSGF